MQEDDITDFTVMMVRMGELHRITISKRLTDIYWEALERFEWEDVKLAFEAHIPNPDCGQFFPKPADIVRWIEGSGETRALRAWSKVEQAIIQVGIYKSIAFDDPLIHIVIEEMGGWIRLCGVTFQELPFRANEFQKRYLGFVYKKPERHPKYLPGLTELENGKNGFPINLPILIGDAACAKEVHRLGCSVPLLTQPLEKSFSEVILAISRAKDKKREEAE
jgi:hypothetical protein